MKDIHSTNTTLTRWNELNSFNPQPYLQQFSIGDEKTTPPPPWKTDLGTDFTTHYSVKNFNKNRSSLDLSIQDDSLAFPCSSSQIKEEPEFYEIDSISKEQQDIHHIKKEYNEKKIKEEDVTFKDEPDEKPQIPHSRGSLKKQDKRVEDSNFYQHKINCLIHQFNYKEDDSIISQGAYDYKRTRFNRTIDPHRKMDIEVLRDSLLRFDKSIVATNPFRHPSKDQKRKLFQIMIRKESQRLRGDVFSHFVQLSLGKIVDGENTYLSWEKSILTKLSVISSHIMEKILKNDSRKDFGRIKGSIPFEENYVHICKRMLIKETMYHALFSIFIEVHGKLENLLISRGSMGYFLNKYSDCFLKELIKCKNKNLFTKKMGRSYFSWKRSRIDILREITSKAQPKFDALFKSDQEMLRKQILLLKNGEFRLLKEEEFQGLISFIERLVNFEGHSGIIERACHHFYVEEYNKRHPRNEIETFDDGGCKFPISCSFIKGENFSEEDRSTNHIEKTEKKFSKKIKEKNKKDPSNEKKSNCFWIAKNYQSLMCNFMKKNEEHDDFLISDGIYDYRYLRHGSIYPVENCEKIEIEVTEKCLSSFDQLLAKDSFSKNPFSRTKERKIFQKKLKNEINRQLKESSFLRFVKMSLPNKLKKTENYRSWKESIIKDAYNLSLTLAEDFLGISDKKDITKFIGRYPISCAKSLIKEILRHGLFSIPIKNEEKIKNSLVSRAGLSQFLNKYSNYFLKILLRYEKYDENFIKGTRSSYTFWKKLKSREINDLFVSFQPSFIEIVKLDHTKIHEEVLILEKDNFRPMTNNEFCALINLINQKMQSKNGSFSDRAVRYFYSKKNVKKKN